MVGDGFKVHQFIPSVKGLDMKRMDPFLMLDYNAKQHVEASSKPKGVGVHPHRGFETVTFPLRLGSEKKTDLSAILLPMNIPGDAQRSPGSGVTHDEAQPVRAPWRPGRQARIKRLADRRDGAVFRHKAHDVGMLL